MSDEQFDDLRDAMSTSGRSIKKAARRGAYETAQAVGEERRRIRIRTLDGTDIRGEVFLEGTEFERRVSSLLNDERTFVAVTDSEMFVNGRRVAHAEFICVNKNAISYVLEE